MTKHLKFFLVLAAVIIICAVNIFNAENMIAAVKASVETCLYIIIPSLFGFMVISGFLIKSGLHSMIFAPLYFVLRFIIHVDREEFSIIMLSLIGGYPVGAKLIADSGRSDTSALLPYCYCAAPVFLMGIVGMGIFGNAKIGLYVYLANAASCFLLSAAANVKRPIMYKKFKADIKINLQIMISSVLSASTSIITVCSMIIFFSLIVETVRFFCGEPLSHGVFSAGLLTFLEISNVLAFPRYNILLLPLIAALTSFGGCCVIMQTAALIGNKINIKPFLLARLPAAVLSAGLCQIIAGFAKVDLSLSTGTVNWSKAISAPLNFYLSGIANPTASVMLIIMAVLLIKNEKLPD
ncbi:MAG: hypothetical protein LBR74_04755 [Eubacterium sp.]|nr:hypothetical protein [Eubacterium sp.]